MRWPAGAMAAWVLLAAPAWADDARPMDEEMERALQRARELSARGEILPLDAILHRAGVGRGRLLEVEMKERRGRVFYELELLDEGGRVREIEVDAKSGRIVREERE